MLAAVLLGAASGALPGARAQDRAPHAPPAALATGAPVGPVAGSARIFPTYHLDVSSQQVTRDVTGVPFFLFARTGAPRLRVRMVDREGTLAGLAVTLDGRAIGVLDRDGLVPASRAPGGFGDDWSAWAALGPFARRGVNHVVLAPRISARPSMERQPVRASWDGELQFAQAVVVDPVPMLRGLRELAAAEEEIYYHLRQFDQYLRDLPRACFPRAFERASAALPDRLSRAWHDLRSRPFVALVQDFYWQAYGRRADLDELVAASAARLEHACWVFEAPGSRPLAAWLYAENPGGRFFHSYFEDVLLAKQGVKNAYLELGAPGVALGERQLEAMLDAQREEVRRLQDLVAAAPALGGDVDREVDRVYATFPAWRGLFRRAFDAKVRAKLWPSRNYPLREDLFAEQVMLHEYFDLVRDLARQDLQQSKVRVEILEAMLSFPPRLPAVPGLAPWHAEGGP